MLDFFSKAGTGIWLVVLLGGLALWLAVRYLRDPNAPLLPLIVGSGVATLIAGCLATVIGIQLSARHIGELPVDKRWIFFLGLDESLNNLVAALIAGIAVSLLAALGCRRQRLRQRADQAAD